MSIHESPTLPHLPSWTTVALARILFVQPLDLPPHQLVFTHVCWTISKCLLKTPGARSWWVLVAYGCDPEGTRPIHSPMTVFSLQQPRAVPPASAHCPFPQCSQTPASFLRASTSYKFFLRLTNPLPSLCPLLRTLLPIRFCFPPCSASLSQDASWVLSFVCLFFLGKVSSDAPE